MTLDPYKLCPCGSGKKVKFCCSRDIGQELERVQRMLEGEQRTAALEKLDSLLRKYPDRPSLLTLKAEAELLQQESTGARKTVERLLQVAPENPTAHALSAMLQVLDQGEIQLAVQQLQRAFEVVEASVTPRMYEALVMLGLRLGAASLPVAAKGHLQLALALSNAKDKKASALLMQLNQSHDIPLLLREPLDLADCPEDVTWKIEFQAAMAEVYRGRWLLGAKKLEDMAKRILDAAPILQNLGVLSAWLGQNQKAVKAFRALSRIRDVPLEERVDAEARAVLLDQESEIANIDIARRTYQLTETDRLMERCLSHSRLHQMPTPPSDPEADEPPPKAVFRLLDRPRPKPTPELQAAELPRAMATLTIYGRQTDREARAELVLPKSIHQSATEELAKELLGDDAGEPVSEESIGKAPRLTVDIFGSIDIPSDIDPNRKRALLLELYEQSVVQHWPKVANPALGGKTPEEAVQEGQSRVPIMAMLTIFECMAHEQQWHLDTNSLREQLKLPLIGPLDPNEVDIERLPMHHFLRLDPTQLTDDQLLTAYRRAYALMFVDALRQLATEVIRRPSLEDRVDRVEAYDILSDIAQTTDEALEYLEKARKLATADGESPAQWLIDELELRLVRGEADRFVELVKEIQTRYMKEPGVSTALMELLAKYELITPDGRLRLPAQRDVAKATGVQETAPAVWTPDMPSAPPTDPAATTEPSAAGEAEEKKESKLWIPGMD